MVESSGTTGKKRKIVPKRGAPCTRVEPGSYDAEVSGAPVFVARLLKGGKEKNKLADESADGRGCGTNTAPTAPFSRQECDESTNETPAKLSALPIQP
jgi:hypothetical protein